MRKHGEVRRHAAGFTYVEMLVVLVLISVLVGAVVVSLRGRTQTFALRTAARDLVAALRFAQAEARLRRCPHRVMFSEDVNAYRVESAAAELLAFTPARGEAGRMRSLPRGISVAGICANGEDVAPDSDALWFGPGGDGFSGRIELVNDRGEAVWIEVIRETGQIHVRETEEPETVE